MICSRSRCFSPCFTFGCSCQRPCPPFPQNDRPAFGGMINDQSASNLFPAGVQQILSMPYPTPANKVEYYSAPNYITVRRTGTYEVNYKLDLTSAENGTLTLAVRVNGIDAIVQSNNVSAGIGSSIFGSAFLTLNFGDSLDLALTPAEDMTMLQLPGFNTFLTVKQI